MNIINKQNLSKVERYWLNDAKNLVTSLSKGYSEIILDKISQSFTNVNQLEASLLAIKTALVRQITLSSINETLVFARTIIPCDTYDFFHKKLIILAQSQLAIIYFLKNPSLLVMNL